MSLGAAARGLTITDPLVKYRALLATSNSIRPDSAQLRLALHLQKLYDRLKDYEPAIEYTQRLNRVTRALDGKPEQPSGSDATAAKRGVWQSLLEQKEKKDSLALTKVLTSHDVAKNMNSPKGLMLHGEVGTGKSMLIDLFADCLPNSKKRRWHFSTFMLEILGTLEQLRRDRLRRDLSNGQDDHSMLWLARDLVTKSPILFLDEFQLPDRAASKIMTNLMASFFSLGGVLIATTNRMPEELEKAAGVAYTAPPTRMESLKWRIGLGGGSPSRSERLFAGSSEFAEFLDVLKARCEIWEMDSTRDYRRLESGSEAPKQETKSSDSWELDDHQDLQRLRETASLDEVLKLNAEEDRADSELKESTMEAPPHYLIIAEDSSAALDGVLVGLQHRGLLPNPPDWQPALMRVYGREVLVPRACGGVTQWTFDELCVSTLGPADYLTLASTFHTLILTGVPVLTMLRKNEARRFITLLDALYEARCKLLITAAAGPDSLFFPDQCQPTDENTTSAESIYSETLAEAYQDATSPFRPNILTTNPSFQEETTYIPSPEPDYTHSRLAPDSLEDDPPNRVLRGSRDDRDRAPVDPDDSRIVPRRALDFGATSAFTGEDERFAYKRARSRLWELCGARWWGRTEEGWWRPLPVEVRRWERSAAETAAVSDGKGEVAMEGHGDVTMGSSRLVTEEQDELMFRHGASPFRTASEPPPKFSWTHVWGTMKWGKKAGAWGQGVDGLEERKREKKG